MQNNRSNFKFNFKLRRADQNSRRKKANAAYADRKVKLCRDSTSILAKIAQKMPDLWNFERKEK